LANAVKDVELIAETTKINLTRSFRKLDLRKRYVDKAGNELTIARDARIWAFEIKY
jgi:hypothetical protein